jgi:translation initiation factor 2B subunit (eIF-2B alpha/beta/delta family)
VSGFASDRTSGSAGVAARFLDELERWALVDRSPDAQSFRGSLFVWLREAQANQPSMALVHQFAARALSVLHAGLQRGDDLTALRRNLAESCQAERDDLAASVASAAKTAAATVTRKGAWIATLSHSSCVLAALRLLQHEGREPKVLVAESRPGYEGRAMAAALAESGIATLVVVDAALPLLLSQATALWIGADAVTEFGVLNKIGSYAAALAAREHGVPVHAIASRRKFLPAGTAALAIAEQPASEVWDTPPALARPRNFYFEIVPLALLQGVVVEGDVIGPTEAKIIAVDRALPDELATAPPKA